MRKHTHEERWVWLESNRASLNFSDRCNLPHVYTRTPKEDFNGKITRYYGKTYLEAVDNAIEGKVWKGTP